MIDIIIFSLPVDRDRAVAIPDGFVATKVAGQNRSRFITADPDDAGWKEAARAAKVCSCVIFCWSQATTTPDAEPMRKLAEKVHAANHAISVELDIGTRPNALANCATYPFHGWRAQNNGWQRFLHGRSFITQIAAAAEQKVIGIDPPLPTAYWRMVRSQAWAMLLGFVALLSFAGLMLGFYRDSDVAKWRDSEGAQAVQAAKNSSKPCEALRAFPKKFPGSAWSNDASDLLETCTKREKRAYVKYKWPIKFYGKSKEEVERESFAECSNLALKDTQLVSVKVMNFVSSKPTTIICTIGLWKYETYESFGPSGEGSKQ